MKTELPRRIESLIAPQAVVESSRALIAPFQRARVEACILWYGYAVDETTCLVTTCVYPPQAHRPRNYAIAATAMAAVRRHVRPHGLLLLTQIHTHPKDAFFSEWDAENALNQQIGALNMVLPDYGDVAWVEQDRVCMVELNEQRDWREWTAVDWSRLRIVPSVLSAGPR